MDIIVVTKNDFWVKLNNIMVTYNKSKNSILVSERLYDLNESLNKLVNQYGDNATIIVEHEKNYDDYCNFYITINSQRSATENELLQILPQVKVEEEKLKKQRERQKLADEKRKLQAVEAERKTYERLRKKYGETKD